MGTTLIFVLVMVGFSAVVIVEGTFKEFRIESDSDGSVDVSLRYNKWNRLLSLTCKFLWPRSIRMWREFDKGKCPVFAMPGCSNAINKNKLPFRFFLKGQDILLIWAVMFFLWPVKAVWNILFYIGNIAVFIWRKLVSGYYLIRLACSLIADLR